MYTLKKVIVIFVLVYAIGFGASWFFRRGFRMYNAHINTQFRELFVDNTPYDVLFVGSSRIHLSINPRIVDSICGTSSFNAGVNGAGLFEFYHVLNAYLEKHVPPKTLVLNLDLFSFADKGSRTFYYPVYLDYTSNKWVDKMLVENGYNSLAYTLLPFLSVTDLDDVAKVCALKGYRGVTDVSPGEFQYRGFLSNSRQTIGADTIVHYKKYVVAEQAFRYLDAIIDTCKNKDIQLIFSYVPEYNAGMIRRAVNGKEILDRISGIARERKIPYWRHDTLSLCKDPLLFVNVGHLNAPGADRYSRVVAKELSPFVQSSSDLQASIIK